MVWNQHHRITTYQPVAATVLAARVERHVSHDRNGTSVTYSPVVEYRYEVAGRAHQSDTVLPLSINSTRSWAQSIVDRYPSGKTTEAYYNPRDPTRAFLFKQYSFFPYFFLLFSMIFLAVAGFVGSATSSSKPPSPPALRPDGWHELKPASTVTARGRRSLVVTGAWLIVGLSGAGHYFSAATPPYETMAIVSTLIYGLLGCIPLGVAVYYLLLRRRMSEAKLFINAPQVSLGQEVALLAQQAASRELQIDELTVSLVCDIDTREKSGGKTRYSTVEHFRETISLLKNRHVRPREPLSATCTLTVPSDRQPSTPPGYKDYPRYRWQIEAHTRIAQSPDYRAQFPLLIQPAA
jgi:hypothetical protein